MNASSPNPFGRFPALNKVLAIGVVTVYLIVLLAAESQTAVIVWLLVGAGLVFLAGKLGIIDTLKNQYAQSETGIHALLIASVLVIAAYFHEDHFILLLVATILMYLVAALGLNVQFGYTGVLNFAGAAFFGSGCYTAAVLTEHTAISHLLILIIGGAVAALVGSLLLLPVLRTRGHYSAVVTIAFSLLFKTFLEVNDALGGPQGLRVSGMTLWGWEFNNDITIGEHIEISFYLNYVVFSLLILILAFGLTRRLERSWVGLNFDSIRLDETAARCFGLNVERWKITAFTLGNFIIGVAGALFAMMLGFIAPTNFTFGDSLLLVSIVLLGGLGSPWGLVIATTIVILIPEKFQIIQEYRFLLYATLVVLMLLFRPDGLVPRQLRSYFPGWQR